MAAAHVVHALDAGAASARIVQHCGAGEIVVETTQRDGELQATMHQRPPEFGAVLETSAVAQLCEGMGAAVEWLDPRSPIQIVSTGHSKVMVPVLDRLKLASLRPDAERLNALSETIGCNGYHCFALGAEEPGVLTTCRMFAPAIGILEDPVTGNGNGPLGAYLVKHGVVQAPHDGTFTFRSAQGHAVDRPGIAEVTVTVKRGEPCAVHVGGHAVVVMEGTMRV